MDKKSQFLYQFRAFFVNSNSIPIPFFSIPIPSPIPGIESGIELNSQSIPELTPTLLTTPRSSQLSPRKHEALKQWWYNVGPTLKTTYQDYYKFN